MSPARILVSVSECARMLCLAGDQVTQSALSRYCDLHSLKLHKSGRSVLVDFESVRRHRAENYTRAVMSGRPGADLAPVPDPGPQLPDPSRELKRIQVRRELRDEAVAEGKLTPVHEVEAGIADAVVSLRSAFAAERPSAAERLAAALAIPPEKIRLIRAAFKDFERLGQARFSGELLKLVPVAGETSGETADRLTALSEMSLRLRSGRLKTA